MQEDYIRLIFGLKVKQVRTNKGLSLFKLSKMTGLSKSYLNEIEKGKKYPKTDKILILADAFEVSYDDLVSLKLDKNLAPVADILQSEMFKEIPLEIFGIEERDLIDIIANAPAKVSAFISTLLEIGNNYNMTKESFFQASLRSFQEANDNYFPEIEKAVKDFLKAYRIKDSDEISEKWMIEILTEEFGYSIRYQDFSELDKNNQLSILRSIFVPRKKELLINTMTHKDQRHFILAKEIGYNFLNLKDRLNTFSWANFNSFDKLLNNFYASYFAGALLLPEEDLVKDLEVLFGLEKHELVSMSGIFKKYTESPETVYQRLTTILPRHFNIKDLFFIRLEHKIGTESFNLTKELHLNKHQSPHANETDEHYCRRWVSVRILKEFEEDTHTSFHTEAQISIYPYHNNQSYYVVSSVTKDPFDPLYLRSVSIGLLLRQAKKKMKFLEDEQNILVKDVAVTCENCGIRDCVERAAFPKRFERTTRYRILNESIEEFIRQREQR
ncbi:MAG: helix-turn-helix domain-containing protein [Flavobacteriaceae bacterium]|jgi:transcriptional regulator with XRE-family HTH domain|nr:helix-turn-helix domain-containing protein [Flavobacteriaceae bacterium]